MRLALLFGCVAAVALASPAPAYAVPASGDPAAADASRVDLAVPRPALLGVRGLQPPPPLGLIVRYALPAAGSVIRGFEAPTSAYGSGHRGVDLDVAVGGAVHAAADGTVHHAGPVAGTVWVSLQHADGILTSYGPLTALQVQRGREVVRGQHLGDLAAGGHGHQAADHGLHWGARRDWSYLDPLSLLRVAERPSLVGPGDWQGTARVVEPYAPYPGSRSLVPPSPRATRPGYATPPNPNHLVLLPGLGTSTGSEVLVADRLGYDPASVTAFSYAGERAVTGARDDPWRDHAPYTAADTWAGVEAAAQQLAADLRRQQAREPGRPVDLVGHSMGGIVALHYLLTLHDPYDPTLPQIGHVVTLGSPIQGSDLALLARAVDDHPLGGWIAEQQRAADQRGSQGGASRLALDAPAIDQLGIGSDLLVDLGLRWQTALRDPVTSPLATGTRVLTIAGAQDRVVGAYAAGLPATHSPGEATSEHRVLPGTHGGVRETEAAYEAVWRFLAGEEVVASEGLLDTRISRIQGEGVRVIARWLRSHDAAAAAEEADRLAGR